MVSSRKIRKSLGTKAEKAKEKAMALDKLLGISPGVKLVVKADREGGVQEAAGSGDGEELSAVAVMCNNSLSEVGELLAMGDCVSWAVVGGEIALYCVQTDENFYLALSGTTTNPRGPLSKLAAAVKTQGSQ